jgi:hypothetical protein
MRTVDVIFDTLSHFVKHDESPPPGIPASVEPDFERRLMRLCEWHSLSPIILESLQRLVQDPGLSEFTFERLKVLSRTVEERQREILPAVESLFRRLRSDGIPFLFMGDILSAFVLYPSPRLRPIGRVDVLVREGDWKKSIDVCRAVGFMRESRDPDFRDGNEALFYYQNLSPCTLLNEKGIVLDLKFRLLALDAPESHNGVWQRGRALAGDDGGATRVSLEDQLFRTCVHLAMSRFERLLLAVDAGLILARHGGELDWTYIEKIARERAFYPAFYFTLETVTNALGLGRLPAGLSRPHLVRQKRFEFLWRPGRLGRLPRKPTRLRRFRFYFLESGIGSDRIRVLSRLLSPRPEWVSAFFGRPCTPWLRLKFVILAFTNRLGRPPSRGEGLRYP